MREDPLCVSVGITYNTRKHRRKQYKPIIPRLFLAGGRRFAYALEVQQQTWGGIYVEGDRGRYLVSMRFGRVLFVLAAMLAGACGCSTDPFPFNAVLDPSTGNVPYQARLTATPGLDSYVFELPDRTVEQSDPELLVTVDTMDWSATVTGWLADRPVGDDTVRATGTNPLPRILRPLINGEPQTWRLNPRERTLIDFSYHERTMAGDETGVSFGGTWRIREIRVEYEEKYLWGRFIADSIFCPPYEPGVFHALDQGVLYENACVIYPLYTSEEGPDGVPYAPVAEAGYTYDAMRNHNLYDGVSFPAQMATIYVTVEDQWGREISASFEIPVAELDYRGDVGDEYEAIFYVASRSRVIGSGSAPIYHRSTCPAISTISTELRVFFKTQEAAQAAGYVRHTGTEDYPGCFPGTEPAGS